MNEEQDSSPPAWEEVSQWESAGIPLARPLCNLAEGSSDPPVDDVLLLGTTRIAAWKDIGALFIILLAYEFGVTSAIAWFLGVNRIPVGVSHAELERLMFIPAVLLRAGGVVALVALILRHRRQPVRSIGLERRRTSTNVFLGLATLAVAYALIFSWQLSLMAVWPGLVDRMAQNAERIMGYVPRLHPGGFVLLALLVGIYEEVLFRGFLMTRFRRATGSWTAAVVLSTSVFAALHVPFQELVAMVPITILSLVFSVVTIWRRSIVPAIVGHWLFNFSQFLGLYYWMGDSWT